MLSGRDVLGQIERMLDDTRGELAKIDTQSERSSAELARLRQAELGVLAVLARVRLREIEGGALIESLDETGTRVTEILAQRREAQAAVNAEIATSQEALAKLEHERTAQHAVVDAAEEVLDDAEAEAQRRLGDDRAYGAMLEEAEASDRMADLAESKANGAHTDRVEKGKPYEADPLFSYLWARGYGTSRYRAGALTRWLDRWVARVCEFEPLRRNYWMLSELPARFDEHAARMRRLADDDLEALRALERDAAETAGVPERERTLEAAEEAQAELDRKIEEQEAAIDALVEKRARFAAGEDDFSRRCMDLLSDALRAEQIRTLRERANRTATPEDDAAIDDLTVVRAETPRLEDEVARYKSLHEMHRGRLSKLEEIRRRFKERHYDASSSEFVNSALIATLLTQLVSGALGVSDVWGSLTKQQRYRKRRSDPHFGSGHFPRGGGGHKPSWRPPGGFGRGGGFGGGGFRTGGGFGKGGGFRTGGGF